MQQHLLSCDMLESVNLLYLQFYCNIIVLLNYYTRLEATPFCKISAGMQLTLILIID